MALEINDTLKAFFTFAADQETAGKLKAVARLIEKVEVPK